VSESIGKVGIQILNKQRINAELLVKSFDGDAVAGEDYVAFDKKIVFRGEESQTIEIQICDDDDPEPDEDFFVQLYDPNLKNGNGGP
jgi:hypothetical protein